MIWGDSKPKGKKGILKNKIYMNYIKQVGKEIDHIKSEYLNMQNGCCN